MGIEIERKFRVCGNEWRALAEPVLYRQGYLSGSRALTVRVRIAGGKAELTLKKSISHVSRVEYNFPIPMSEAEEILEKHCDGRLIEKNRYRIAMSGLVWEVDEFHGANEGLIVAEVELGSEDEAITRPPWVGEEITADGRYRNASLARHPYCEWKSK